MKDVEYTFCMKQFKPAIAGLAVLIVFVVAWTGWHSTRERGRALHLSFPAGATTAAAAIQPTAPPIRVKDKMTHPYWGNCSECHVTIDAGKPVSKVMAGAPISIKDKMVHKYWGNCLLCHKVTDGLQPGKTPARAKAAAMTRLTARSVGLKVQTVTAAMMRQFGLANEDGVLILEVAHNSIAEQAGLMKGDEIIRAGKTRTDNTRDFEKAINAAKPGSKVKINIYRGTKSRNLIMKIPKNLNGALAPAAATAPMTQNRIETLAEQLGVPKTRQDVTRALQNQKQGQVVANLNFGKVAVAAFGPGLDYQVAHRFGASPYFIVFDPQQNSYRVATNPNANDATGRGVQTGQYMVDLGTSSVVAGEFTQNALNTLHTLRVNAYAGVTGTVRHALSSYLAGRFRPVNTNSNLRATVPQVNANPGGAVPRGQTIF